MNFFRHAVVSNFTISLFSFFYALYFSVSTMPSGLAEVNVQQNFESDAITVSYPSASASELQSAEQTIASKVSTTD